MTHVSCWHWCQIHGFVEGVNSCPRCESANAPETDTEAQ